MSNLKRANSQTNLKIQLSKYMDNNKKVQSLKTDFLFLNEMTRPNPISNIQVPTNLSELHNILKNKNSKIPFTNYEREIKTQQMTLKSGVDISKIKEQIRKAKQVVYRKQQIKKIQQDCHFYIPDMSHKNIHVYLQKANQYGILSTISKVMKKTNYINKIMKRNQQKLSGIKSFDLDLPQKQLGIIKQIKTQIRDMNKRQKYIKSIQLVATDQIQKNYFVNYLSGIINKKFWLIFSRHVSCLEQHRPDSGQRNLYLYLESLKLVQQEYDEMISKRSNSLMDFIDDYLRKATSVGASYIRDSEHKSFWGKVFILYRAGRFRDVYNLLGSRNENHMLTYVRRTEEAIEKKCPIVIQNIHDQQVHGDIFREEFLYILKGQLKYSNQILLNYDSLDIIWVYLRSLAIFPQKEDNFQQMKMELMQKYKQEYFQSKTILHNYLYLLCYDKIAEKGLSEIMDQDDYLHFLIALYQQPQFIDRLTYEKVEQILTQSLVFYIKQLINMNRNQYIYYMGLIPLKNRNSQISTILSSFNLVQSLNWGYFNKILTREDYQILVRSTLQKYLFATSDYLVVAGNYVKLLNGYEDGIKCLLKLLMKNSISNHLNSEQVLIIEKQCENYLNYSLDLQEKYKFTTSFIKNCRKLQGLLQERNYQAILSLIHENPFIIYNQNYDIRHIMMLVNAVQILGMGVDVYCKFVKNIIKGIQLYYARQVTDANHKVYLQRIRQAMDIVFNEQKFKIFKNREESKSILELLNSLDIRVVQL